MFLSIGVVTAGLQRRLRAEESDVALEVYEQHSKTPELPAVWPSCIGILYVHSKALVHCCLARFPGCNAEAEVLAKARELTQELVAALALPELWNHAEGIGGRLIYR